MSHSAVVLAQAEGGQQAGALEEIVVVGITPVPGAGLDRARMPANAQAATADDIARQLSLNLTEFMQRRFGSVFANDAQSNPLQPDVRFRGFVASPLLGLPQGMSIYQEGVRINEPFGDTVNWALVPESAIAGIDLIPGSNPVFGLNTLGGALAIRTKDGFSHPGTRVEVSAGSWERKVAQAETGGTLGEGLSYFVSGWYFDEDGWRDDSPSEAKQLFSRVGWHTEDTQLDLSVSYADTDLIGNGAAPIQLLELEREAIFTRPDQTRNDLLMVNLQGSHAFGELTSLNGVAYLRDSDIDTYNGDDSDFEECEDPAGFVCSEDDGVEELTLDPNGDPIPYSDALDGATVNRSSTEQDGYGGSLQMVFLQPLAGFENQLTVGASYDESDVDFGSSTELGSLDESRQAIPGGVFVGESFTRLETETNIVGVYFTNTISVNDKLALTLSGRYNDTEIELRDQLGTALNGNHEFSRFNPSAGFTYNHSTALQLYGAYSESNRAPSPVELTCADPDDPCRLPNAFLSDPPLDDVVAKTWEGGIRGSTRGINYHLGLFYSTNEDDIIFISAGALTNEGFFDNVGDTRRQGVELNLTGSLWGERVGWFIDYTCLEATFREDFSVASPNNPEAVDGQIAVQSGDRLPAIPEHLFKAGANVVITPALSVGVDLSYSSNLVFRGDEGNLADTLSGYTVVNVGGEYQLNTHASVFVKVDNVFDEEYETFGLFGEADEVLGDEFDDSRFLSPGAERAAWVGVRLAF